VVVDLRSSDQLRFRASGEATARYLVVDFTPPRKSGVQWVVVCAGKAFCQICTRWSRACSACAVSAGLGFSPAKAVAAELGNSGGHALAGDPQLRDMGLALVERGRRGRERLGPPLLVGAPFPSRVPQGHVERDDGEARPG
jgi:hypothetical protein